MNQINSVRPDFYWETGILRVLLVVSLIGTILPSSTHAGDEDIFAAQIPPNVALFVDNSGSMDIISEHPFYDASTANSPCNPFEDVLPTTGSFFNFLFDDNGLPTIAFCGGPTIDDCFLLPQADHPGYTLSASTVDHPLTGSITREFCGNSIELWHDGEAQDNNSFSYYPGRYVSWLFSLDRTDTTTVLTGPDGETMTPAEVVADINDSENGRDFITGTFYGKYQRVRITSARNIASDVIYRTNTDCPAYTPSCAEYEDRVRFGLAIFDPFSHGAYMKVPIDEYSVNRAALESSIGSLEAQTATPLGESLFKLYTYFMSRDLNDRPFGQNGSTKFPEYRYRTSDGWRSSDSPPSPVEESCQQNFVIMITDGEPTADNFISGGSQRGVGFSDFDDLIGDYFVDDPSDTDFPETGVPPWVSSTSSGYLDDVAAFMQENDFRPDFTQTNNKIDVYTVGFSTVGVVNALLEKTAENGNGLFFTGNQSELLTEALVSSVQDIISKSQGFAAATVPAARTSDGGNLYTSLFQPTGQRPFWPGALRSYRITADGQILDSAGNCALEGLADPTFCDSGTFRPVAVSPPFWDASSEMPQPNNRNLYVSLPQNASQIMVNFDHSLTAADLGLGGVPVSDFNPVGTVNSTADLDEAVVGYVAGCEWGTGMVPGGTNDFGGCTGRTIVSGGATVPDRLGDIFHSNPVVVGPPALFLPEPSYAEFTLLPHTVHRERLIYTGANDGFLHAFNAGTFDSLTSQYDEGTGVEKFGFMPWAARTVVQDLAKSSATLHPLTVDGAPSVSDVWFDRNGDPNDDKIATEWRTVMVGGLREGGEHYYALDITDPASNSFPEYLWEFPTEADTTARAYVAQTWSTPVITRVRLQDGVSDVYETWVAIVGFGYDPKSDPNVTGPAGYDPSSLKGRGIAMIEISTGRPVAIRKFGTAIGDVPDMLYAIPSQPGVLDVDQDGFADLIYIGDVGGNIWKWVIRDPGTKDPAAGQLYQPNWPFRKFFDDDPTRPDDARARSFFFSPAATLVNGILHLGIGSGERADLTCDNSSGCTLGNRYYVLKERDLWDSGQPATIDGRPATTGNLTDVTLIEDSCPAVEPEGFFFSLLGNGEKFITNSEVFNSFFFASTFEPDISNVCEPTGNSLLYGFLARCGQGFFGATPAASPIAGSERSLDLGGGVPTDARLSIAPGDGGNRLIISKQDGELFNMDSGSSDSEHGTLYWREID